MFKINIKVVGSVGHWSSELLLEHELYESLLELHVWEIYALRVTAYRQKP